MNDLSTQQIILLCLLVSFVTSIATGITTVSLLDQAPEPVTQTINRVVERTVEKVVEPAEDPKDPPVERIVETVVVNQEDLTVEAVAKNETKIARIFALDRFENRTFAGLGVVVGSDGKMITDASVALQSNSFVADYQEGTFPLNIVGEPTDGVAIFTPVGAEGIGFSSAQLGDSQKLKLAQSVIVISGQSANTVATGIITGLVTAAGNLSEEEVNAETVPTEVLTQINTSVSAAEILPGSVLITLKGDIVGINAGNQTLGNSFSPSNALKLLIAS